MVSLSLNFVTRSALRSSAGRAEGRRGETLQRDLPGGGIPPREGHMDKGWVTQHLWLQIQWELHQFLPDFWGRYKVYKFKSQEARSLPPSSVNCLVDLQTGGLQTVPHVRNSEYVICTWSSLSAWHVFPLWQWEGILFLSSFFPLFQTILQIVSPLVVGLIDAITNFSVRFLSKWIIQMSRALHGASQTQSDLYVTKLKLGDIAWISVLGLKFVTENCQKVENSVARVERSGRDETAKVLSISILRCLSLFPIQIASPLKVFSRHKRHPKFPFNSVSISAPNIHNQITSCQTD